MGALDEMSGWREDKSKSMYKRVVGYNMFFIGVEVGVGCFPPSFCPFLGTFYK